MNDDLLIAYSAACAFFARVLRPGLDAELLRQCAADRIFDAWPLPRFGTDAPDGLMQVAGALVDLSDVNLVRIEEDNTALFIGPENPVPMWESVWTTEDHLLFEDCTTAVEKAFAAFGFAIADPVREPSDHLAYELAFMAALMARAGEYTRTGKHDAAREHMAAASQFADDHLFKWADLCLNLVAQRANSGFYRGVALLCIDTLKGLGADLGRLQDLP